MTQKSSFFIAGRHAVISALKNPARRVLKIFLTEDSKKNIHIVIKGKDTSGEEKCEYYDIDSATCLKINIV